MSIVHYEQFLQRVDKLGFMPLSTLSDLLPSLSEETRSDAWHTGDPDTDPWRWKDRVASEKRLAYGCILGGHKGFVSARMYRYFYMAYQPVEPMEERWAAGEINQSTWQLWRLFEERQSLDTAEIRQMMGVTAKRGGSRVDSSIQELQRDYHITVSGNRRKVNRAGEPYGWPASVYERAIDWAPADWLTEIAAISREEAREAVLDAALSIGKTKNRRELAKALRLYKSEICR